MLSKNAIDFSDCSQVSSFGSNDSLLNQDPEEEDKKEFLEGKNRNDEDDMSGGEDNAPDEPKGGPRKKGQNNKDVGGMRGYPKARKIKMVPKKKEPGLSRERVYLYKPFVPLPDLSEFVNSQIEIRIGISYINAFNPALIKRHIWGNESYTSHSDAVCILKHAGLVDFTTNPEKRNCAGLSLICAVGRCNTRRNYTSCLKNGLKSRKISGYMGFSLKPVSIQWLSSLGDPDELIFFASRMCNIQVNKRVKTVPVNVKKFPPIPEQTIVFNICNEPSTKYALISIADKSSDHEEYTSYFLKSKVLYLETNETRYELAKTEDSLFDFFDKYKFSRIKDPLKVDNLFMELNSIPLENDFLEVLYTDLDWQEIKWGFDYIIIRDKTFKSNIDRIE